MPLKKGSTSATISANIGELVGAGHPVAQAAAIAYKYANGEDGAAGIMYRAADSVLLLLRSPSAGDYPMTWCFPGGGIDEGETPEQAAIRESTEETGFTPSTELRMLDWSDGFTTFATDLPEPFAPVLNGEHIGYAWVPLDSLPTPMHPGCAATLACMSTVAMDERVIDGNGWTEYKATPISKVGIFPYSGRQLGLDGPQADKIFQVYRPEEELSDPACVESFRLVPWIDEHTMLGPVAATVAANAVPAERKGVQGVIGEQVFYDNGKLFANLKVFSSTLDALIGAGKRELSAGYRCKYELTPGVWNGQAYDAVQRKIRGNHLASVAEGRMGPDVAIMDRFTFSFDAQEPKMADPTEPSGDGEMTLAQVAAAVKQLLPLVKIVGDLQSSMAAPAVTAAEPVGDATTPPAAAPAATAPAAPPATPAADAVPPATAMDAAERSLLTRIGKRDALVAKLSSIVGTFDHASMTHDDVVKYGCEKLGIAVNADVLSGYLAAKPAGVPPRTVAGLDGAETPERSAFQSKLKGA